MQLIFYYGSDFFSAKEAIEKKSASFLAKNPEGLVEKFDFEGGDRLKSLKDVLKRRSLFDQPELIIVYAYFSASELEKKDKELFKFLIKQAQETREFKKSKTSEKPVNNFSLADALGERDVKKSVVFLNQALENNESQMVLGQVVYQFRNLLRVKALLKEGKNSSQIAELAGLHPYVAKKTSQQAKNFELSELKNIFQRLADLDLKSKTGQIDLSTGLFKFLLQL